MNRAHLYTTRINQRLGHGSGTNVDLELTAPRFLINIKGGDRVLKVSNIGKTMGTQRSELRENKVLPVDLLDICWESLVGSCGNMLNRRTPSRRAIW